MPSPSRKTVAYEHLKQAILARRLTSGQPIVEETIAQELGISRTPVREAIRELSREGLVETIQNKGTFVKGLSAQDLLDIFDIKIRLEGLCAARAAQNDGPAIAQRLFRATEAMAEAARTNDRNAYLRADEAYHHAIYEGTQSERVQRIIADLNTQWHQARPGMAVLEARMAVAVDEHRQIAEAIHAGDSDAAERAMRVHLENLRNEIRGVLEDFVIPLRGVK